MATNLSPNSFSFLLFILTLSVYFLLSVFVYVCISASFSSFAGYPCASALTVLSSLSLLSLSFLSFFYLPSQPISKHGNEIPWIQCACMRYDSLYWSFAELLLPGKFRHSKYSQYLTLVLFSSTSLPSAILIYPIISGQRYGEGRENPLLF